MPIIVSWRGVLVIRVAWRGIADSVVLVSIRIVSITRCGVCRRRIRRRGRINVIIQIIARDVVLRHSIVLISILWGGIGRRGWRDIVIGGSWVANIMKNIGLDAACLRR